MVSDRLIENLKKKGYVVSNFTDIEDAINYLCASIKGKTVGFGGSMTLEEMGLYELLEKNNTMFWQWRTDDKAKTLKDASQTEIYFSSVNAIAETGEIINIDGTGNRVASTIYGHEKVYFVLGTNKITKDLDSAIYRARNVAAPLNAKRLKCNTPCAKKCDKCYDCNSPDRICKALSVFIGKPTGCEYEVVIIDKELGF